MYNFVATHFDGHGSSAVDDFTVTVVDQAPVFTTVPSPALGDVLVEDDHTNTTSYQIPINTDDESLHGVTYSAWVYVGNSAPALNDPSWIEIKTGTDPTLQLNGIDGGWITYDKSGGTIEWKTTNADVNYMSDGTTLVDATGNQKSPSSRWPPPTMTASISQPQRLPSK